MSAAAEAPPSTTDPDPPRAAAVPGAIGRVLGLVRKLIDYGKQIAGTLQQRAAAPDFAYFAKPFGTADLAVILIRITNGLRRAAALEARLCRRAERGRDLVPAPIRPPVPHGPRAPRSVTPPAATPDPQPPSNSEDPRLARLLTEDEIAAEMRRRPVGAVIVDICNDLGIAPGDLDYAFWDEISLAIIRYGGNLARFLNTLFDRVEAFASNGHAGDADPGWPGASLLPRAPATGPP